MKKWNKFFLSIMLVLALAACSQDDSSSKNDRSTAIEKSNVEEKKENKIGTNAHILIAYFGVPEDVKTSDYDAIARASIVVKDSEKMGNTEYVAKLIEETIGGDLFQIETREAYPLEHEALVNQAADEQDKGLRPELSSHVENFEQYDTIILGYPNWWGDLPMPVYSFLEEYDFSGKTIIPFVTHGGSGFSGTRDTISKLQPNANVSDNTLSMDRENVADGDAEVKEWAESLKEG
ncbi:MAG: flavodoxin [Lachnospiraceae bacterium]|nr:flavodoxin [Lachnospiraceae bacterium]